MYAPYNSTTKKHVGMLWGVNVKGIIPFYHDDHTNVHYTIDIKDGMCGEEEVHNALGRLVEGGVVVVKGSRYIARFGGAV